MFQVRIATINDIEIILPLFLKYREFYNYNLNIEKSKEFLIERINKNQSKIFLCYFNETNNNNNNSSSENNNNNNEIIVGFAQIYFSFDSLLLQPLFILHDLYVTSDYRKQGIGSILLNIVKEYARNNNGNIVLQTAKDNFTAQSLYEHHGYIKDEDFYTYYLIFENNNEQEV